MFKIFLRNFLKTIGIMALFIALGFGGYYGTMLFFKATTVVERSTQYKHVITIDPGSESSNLIYCLNPENKKIEALVLELLDKESGNLDYITIPINLQINLSAADFQEFSEKSQQIPQIASIKDINKYFTGDVAYEYGILLLQKELDVDIGYFTMYEKNEFEKRFKKENRKFVLREEYVQSMYSNKDSESMNEFLKQEWKSLVSDLTLSQKQSYVEAFLKVKPELIYYHRAYAEEVGNIATLNSRKTKKLVNRIWETPARTAKQSETKSNNKVLKKVKTKSIQITNGSEINGLAASFSERLTNDGFNIIGVGNYTGDVLDQTVIYTKKEKWGKALAGYFNNPRVEVSTDMTNSADLEIVLGKNDGNTNE